MLVFQHVGGLLYLGSVCILVVSVFSWFQHVGDLLYVGSPCCYSAGDSDVVFGVFRLLVHTHIHRHTHFGFKDAGYVFAVASPRIWLVIFRPLLCHAVPVEVLFHPPPNAVCSLLHMCLLKAISQALVRPAHFTQPARRFFVFQDGKINKIRDSLVNRSCPGLMYWCTRAKVAFYFYHFSFKKWTLFIVCICNNSRDSFRFHKKKSYVLIYITCISINTSEI